jgi:hypothetical protein
MLREMVARYMSFVRGLKIIVVIPLAFVVAVLSSGIPSSPAPLEILDNGGKEKIEGKNHNQRR